MPLLIVYPLNARSSEKLVLHILGCLRKVFGKLKTKGCHSIYTLCGLEGLVISKHKDIYMVQV